MFNKYHKYVSLRMALMLALIVGVFGVIPVQASAEIVITSAPLMSSTSGEWSKLGYVAGYELLLDEYILSVNTAGNGSGTITGTGINCPEDCSEPYALDTSVTLTATPATGSIFTGWSGDDCTGTDSCIVSMTAAKLVTATFTLQTFALSIDTAGTGSGSVTGTGISCPGDCSETYDYNTSVTLTATPAIGSTFTGWSGDCTGTGSCMVSMTAARSVTATFTLQTFALSVSTAGNGSGTVTGTGISCPADCLETYDYDTSVTLTASPATGSTFTGWSGDCTGTGSCIVSMTTAKSVTATFTLQTFALSVSTAGNGSGTVTGTGISCPGDCSETYDYNTSVTLTASPATGSTFTGWSGACAGTGSCIVSMTAVRSVTATFTLQTFALSVSTAGNGSGIVTGTGISCPSDCSETYDYNNSVTLTASPATGSTFTGWSGACTGTGSCIVSMTAARSVTATFTLQTFALSVSTAGTGSGAVTGTGINCPGDCSETYNYNTSVTLTATPTTGSTFTGWSGACAGIGSCIVSMTAARSVTATFTLQTFALSVSPAGNGSGIVTGTGISCPGDCSETYNYNTSVTLTATPTTGSTFVGWSGACTGTGSCIVSMTVARSVTATFTLQTFALSVSTSGTGSGTVTGTGINCPGDCSEIYNYGTSVTLTANPISGSTFAGWSGVCTGTGSCIVSITAAKSVSAAYCPSITNWKSEYWPNASMTGSPVFCRNDLDLNFDWSYGSPDPLIPVDGFSARWTQAFNFNSSGIYRFYVWHDDGARLYIDNGLQLDVWNNCCVLDTVDVAIQAGTHTIRMEYLENAGAASAQLWWEQISQQTVFSVAGNAGVAGAVMSYMDGTPKTATADGSGVFTISVPLNWSGTVTPSKACYTFSPVNRAYPSIVTDQTAQNYSATYVSTYTITGNTGIAGATLSYMDGTLKTVTSNGSGNYSFTIPCAWSGTVTLSKTGYLFAPAVRMYNNVISNQTGQNYNLYNVTPADFNGDGKIDVAVFRPTAGVWYISGQGSFALGQAGDIPVPADYNGDGKDELAVFRPSEGNWYISGQASITYGIAGDIPVVADYNGDGKADIAVFRQSNSTWYVRGQGSFAYGTIGDIPVVADYNGDGKADIAVFRPTNSTWYLYGIGPRVYGTVGDIPVIADYNGDGKADIAVFRPTNSTWYVYGIGPSVYGTVGDIPAIGDYNGDGKADITVFRPTNSTWYKYGVGPSVYGTVGDIPV